MLPTAVCFGLAMLWGPSVVHSDDIETSAAEGVVATEQNFEWFPNFYLIRWMPQVHWQIHAHFQWQVGFGIRHLDNHTSGEAATRLIAEF